MKFVHSRNNMIHQPQPLRLPALRLNNMRENAHARAKCVFSSSFSREPVHRFHYARSLKSVYLDDSVELIGDETIGIGSAQLMQHCHALVGEVFSHKDDSHDKNFCEFTKNVVIELGRFAVENVPIPHGTWSTWTHTLDTIFKEADIKECQMKRSFSVIATYWGLLSLQKSHST